MGVCRRYRSFIPTFVVGNLRVGGTGKTPHTEYIIRLLNHTGQIALVSRGYGRKTRGYILANDLLNNQLTAENIGDEPLQIMEKFSGLQVVVSEKRVVALRALEQLPNPPQAIILDDAYQHVAIQAGLNILLTEYNDPYYNDLPFPAGNLREFASAARHADLVIVTKSPVDFSQQQAACIREKLRLTGSQIVLFSYYIYNNIIPKNSTAEAVILSPSLPVLLITGIAKPDPMKQYLTDKFHKIKHLSYQDHHTYTKQDIEKIKTAYSELEAEAVVITTEKDWARLKTETASGLLSHLPVFVLPISVAFLFDEEDKFIKIIEDHVRESTENSSVLE
jgi:tetraacyldisaccharide 4'-kinase